MTNMSSIDASVKRVGSTAFKLVMQVGQDSAKLASLDKQVRNSCILYGYIIFVNYILSQQYIFK